MLAPYLLHVHSYNFFSRYAAPAPQAYSQPAPPAYAQPAPQYYPQPAQQSYAPAPQSYAPAPYAPPVYSQPQSYASPAYAQPQTYAAPAYGQVQTYGPPAYGSPYTGFLPQQASGFQVDGVYFAGLVQVFLQGIFYLPVSYFGLFIVKLFLCRSWKIWLFLGKFAIGGSVALSLVQLVSGLRLWSSYTFTLYHLWRLRTSNLTTLIIDELFFKEARLGPQWLKALINWQHLGGHQYYLFYHSLCDCNYPLHNW